MAPACFNSIDRADAVVDELVIVALLSSYSTEMYAYSRLISAYTISNQRNPTSEHSFTILTASSPTLVEFQTAARDVDGS